MPVKHLEFNSAQEEKKGQKDALLDVTGDPILSCVSSLLLPVPTRVADRCSAMGLKHPQHAPSCC